MLSSIRHAVRQLVKSPGFIVVSMATLALGLGINTTAFTVLNRVMLQRLPFRDPGRLVQIYQTSPQQNDMAQSPGDFFDERDGNSTFEGMALYYLNGLASLTLPGKTAQTAVTMPVSSDYFPVMGISPMIGRAFTADEEAHQAPLVILSNAFWRRNFGGDPGAIGKTLRLDGKTSTVIGVMPPLFDDPMLFGRPLDLWRLDNAEVNRDLRDKSWYSVAGRLKPGVTPAQAQAELNTISARLAHDFPKTNTGRGFRVIPYPTSSIGDLGRNITWMIMGLSLVVLLIVCVNLANLQLVRTTARSREFAIRVALGASRTRLIGMLLVECLLLSLAGGALGLLVTRWGDAIFAANLQIDLPLDLRDLAFAIGVSALAGAVCGTLPAWIATRSDANAALKQGSRGSTADRSRHRIRKILVVAQLSMALVLLTGAGYYIRGIQKLSEDRHGWRSDHILVGIFSLDHDRFGEEGDERSRVFGDRFMAKIRSIPGVDGVSLSRGLPAFGRGGDDAFRVEGTAIPEKGKAPTAGRDWVSPDYFPNFGIRLEQGRLFTDADRPGSPKVAVISHSMAQRYWPNENPLGKRIGETDPANPNWHEIVGVVSDVTGFADPRPVESVNEIYSPWDQYSNRFLTFSVHTSNDPRSSEDAVRKALATLAPEMAISVLSSADDLVRDSLSGLAMVRSLLAEIAALGLLLSAIGLYGVIANLVSERTQEVGIRMALGAAARDVLWLFLSDGIRLSAIGAGIGLLLSFALMSALKSGQAVIPGASPWIVVGVAALLVAVALAASWLPARRATKLSPLEALRSD